MSTKTLQTIHKSDGDETRWEEAAKLFSENYGVWGPGSGREGKRVKLGKQRLVEQYLPDERSTYTSVLVNGKLAGQAFASRWEYDGKTVCWITQLVVHRDYRQRGLATTLMYQLREDDDDIFGIMSSHPAACLAAADAYSKSIEKIDISFIKEHARAIINASPVEYVRRAAPKGTVFDEDSSGLVSGVDSEFHVDHTVPLEVLEAVRQEYWPLGDLPEGHEFLLLLHPRPRRSRSSLASKTPGALNVATWQTPNTLLTQGLSVSQAMAIVVIARLIVSFFSCVVGWCGLTWNVGFTVQNRFTWGMRGSYIPLLQRCLLDFIWNVLLCWNGGKLVTVCITAIWPSFGRMKNTLPSNIPATTDEMDGFIVFWVISVPFLFIRPERFKKPFFVSSLGCGLAMLVMMIWSVAVAGGVVPVFYKGQDVPSTSRWGVSWIMMAGLNQAIGQKAAGMVNESGFSRYSNSYWGFVLGGLVTTAAFQVIYGDIWWNPPDLMMVMMDDGNGSSASRAGVFFLALAFTFAVLSQNVCGNAVAGGIDLAGIFPRYIDIRRGAIITFVATWVIQPWQLINRASTFTAVLSFFSVFLAPLMGVMICDYYFLRRRKIRQNHVYRPENSYYWFWHGVNWSVIPCWIAGWAPTIGGLIVSVGEMGGAPDALFQLYYTAFFTGLAISFITFYAVNLLFPVKGLGEFDVYDDWSTFTPKEAEKLGVVPHENAEELVHTGFGSSGYERRGPKATEKELEAGATRAEQVSVAPGESKPWWTWRKG